MFERYPTDPLKTALRRALRPPADDMAADLPDALAQALARLDSQDRTPRRQRDIRDADLT